jgi:hypothetical protein
MNKDEMMNLVGPTVAMLAPVVAKYGFSAGDMTAFLSGLVGIVFAVYNHWDMKKVPETAKVVGGMFLVAILLGLASPSSAADVSPMAVKAPVYTRSTPCTVTSCTGFFVGANIANAGGNFDIVGTGLTGLAQNGLGIGGQVGYEFWNGQWYAAILADLDTDMSLNAQTTVGVPTNFRDRLTYGVKARLGYSLASAFGAATTGSAAPTLPQQFLASLMTPYIVVGEEWRHSQPALVSGAGVEALLATNVTLNADILHYSYNQGGTSGNVAGIPTAQTGDNEFRLSINRHFGF